MVSEGNFSGRIGQVPPISESAIRSAIQAPTVTIPKLCHLPRRILHGDYYQAAAD